jgi:hypothetical protein
VSFDTTCGLFTISPTTWAYYLSFNNGRARHWINVKNRDDIDLRHGVDHFFGDRGRAALEVGDMNEKCIEIKDISMQCSVLDERKDCPWACNLYLDSSFYEDGRFEGPGLLD